MSGHQRENIIIVHMRHNNTNNLHTAVNAILDLTIKANNATRLLNEEIT
jgi:hypothetical protein